MRSILLKDKVSDDYFIAVACSNVFNETKPFPTATTFCLHIASRQPPLSSEADTPAIIDEFFLNIRLS